MGAFITNFQVRSNSTSAVREALTGLVQSRAYVSTPKNGWVTIYDEASDGQNDVVIRRLAQGLSRTLKTNVLGFLVHDSDIAVYWLYRCGELVDEFNSAPDYFGEQVDDSTRARLRGDTDVLLPLCIAGTTRAQVDAVIHPPDGPPLMAEEILADLAKLLGIDDSRIILGFKYFDEEGEEILPDVAEFEPVGKGAGRRTAKIPEPVTETPSGLFDTFVPVISMITQCWNDEHEKGVEAVARFSGGTREDMLKQLRSGFDRGARDMLKHSKLAGRPTFEELQAARDQGPDALAKLLAQRMPAQLAEIGISAASLGSEQFIAALLAQGLDPNATGVHGRTPLSAATQRGKDSKVYQLLKAASDRRS